VALIDEILPASYKNAFFFVAATETAGGRKTSKKEIIDSDLQVIEDLGLANRIFTLEGIISARFDNNGNIITSYKDVRDNLLRALESRGSGILVHPFFGTVENLVVIDWEMAESFDRLGIANISITFEVSNTDGKPKPITASLSAIEGAAQQVLTTSSITLAEKFEVVLADASGNFADASAKVTAAIEAINSITEPFSTIAGLIDEFSQAVSKALAQVTTLVDTPVELADSITNLILTANSVVTTVEGTYKAFISLFPFGDDDIPPVFPTTAQSIERQENRDQLNDFIQAVALSLAYTNAAQMEFKTVSELEAVAEELEEQYRKLFESLTLSSDILANLNDLRDTVQEFFDDVEPSLKSIVSIRTNPTSARLLAYKYYGSSELGAEITDLNDLSEPIFLEGEVDIFSFTSQ
jgi:prophage DNA circulation protein